MNKESSKLSPVSRYIWRNHKIVVITTFLVLILLIITLLVDSQNESNKIVIAVQSLLISYISSVVLYYLVEVYPSYKRTMRVNLFANEYFSALYETMTDIITHFKMAANISIDDYDLAGISNIDVDFTNTIYYIKKRIGSSPK